MVFSHTIYRAKLLVLLLDIAGKQVEIQAYGGQARMSQYPLQAEDIASVDNILFGEAVAKRVR